MTEADVFICFALTSKPELLIILTVIIIIIILEGDAYESFKV